MPRTATPAVEQPEPAAKPACVHHWLIETPDGALMSRGVCKRCGATKEFPASAEDGLWERDVPKSRWTGRADAQPVSDGF